MSKFISQGLNGRSHWAYYVLTIAVVLVAYVFGQLPMTLVLRHKVGSGQISSSQLRAFYDSLDFTTMGIEPYFGLFLLVLGHIFAAIALVLCVIYIHGRPFRDIATSRDSFDCRRFLFGYTVWFGLTLLLECVFYLLDPLNYQFEINWQDWLPLVFVGLLVIPIQTSLEELFIRGFLLQGVGVASNSSVMAILITSGIFVAIHMRNPEVSRFGLGVMITYYASVAIFLAVLTLVDEGLELALGIHAATNLYGALLVTFDGSVLQTHAPAKILRLDAWWMTLGFIVMIVIFYIIASRKYNFKNLSSVLSKVSSEEIVVK